MIPKIIHYCWLSNDPYPGAIQYCIDSWKKKLPDYEFILWNFDRFPKGKSKWVDEAFAARKYAFAADYIRLYALYNFGGIYLDSDVEVLRPFDDLLNLPYFLGMEGTPSGIEAATLGFEKGNEMIGNLLKRYEGRSFYKEDGEIDKEPLPYIIRNEIDTNFKYCPIIDVSDFDYDSGVINVFPVDWFSPKSWDTKEITVTEKTYSIHHFEGSWLDDYKDMNIESVKSGDSLLISILIPVYNTAHYLDRCMNAVTKQTYGNIEIILVDDGSTDRSAKMCDRWVAIDSRVKVVHQENKGLFMARKVAVDLATGDYQIFVDSDDWIDVNTCQEIFDMISKSKEKMDIIHFGTVIETQGKVSESEIKSRDYIFNRQVHCKNSKELLTEAYIKKSFVWNMWGKAYKKELLKKAFSFMPEVRCTYAEDLFTSYLIYSISNNLIPLPKRLYHYSVGSGMSTQKSSIESLRNVLQAYNTFDILKKVSQQKELEFKNSIKVLNRIEDVLDGVVIEELCAADENVIDEKIDMSIQRLGAEKIVKSILDENRKIQQAYKNIEGVGDNPKIGQLESALVRSQKKNKKHLKQLRILMIILGVVLLINLLCLIFDPRIVMQIYLDSASF